MKPTIEHLQKRLDCIAEADSLGFLQNIKGNWENHRGLLLLALDLTQGPVTELGAGEGSTGYLRQYCDRSCRHFRSFDNNSEWAVKTGSTLMRDWDNFIGMELTHGQQQGVLFIDHAPGEHRKVAISALANRADIIVIHDTEEGGAGDYKFDTIWPLFKYRLNYNRLGGGAGASAVSNQIDLNGFRGLSLGNYKFDDD